MAYLGRWQLGQEVPLAVLCVDGSDTPTAPSVAPYVDIYSATGKPIGNKQIPAQDRYGITGRFSFRQFLDGRFSAGQYTVLYRYAVGSYNGLVTDTFQIVAGGSAYGTPLAIHYFHKPEADYVVQALTSGKIVKNRNPSL